MKLKFTASTVVEVHANEYDDNATTKDILESERANFDLSMFESADEDNLELKVELVCPPNQPELPGLPKPQPQQSSQPTCHRQ